MNYFFRLSIFNIQILCLVTLMIMFTGCATYNPATGRNEFIFISTQEEVAMGQSIQQQLEKENEFTTDQKYMSRVERVGRSVSQVSDRQDYAYTYRVIKSNDLNAFTTPGGNIYIYTGLLDKLATDDQLAFVLGHEIGHGAAKHVVKKYQAALGYNLIGSILLDSLEPGAGRQIAQMSTGAVMNLVFSAYSRQDELQSDRLGIKYALLSGYDMDGAIAALEVLLESEAKGGKAPAILRSHPYVKDRIDAAREEISRLQQQYGIKN